MKRNYALVTGASSGIGQAACIKIAELGYDIIINYHNNYEGALETKRLVEAIGTKAILLRFDVSDSKSISENLGVWLQENQDCFVEVLINNAGYRNDKLMVFMKDEEWNGVINTNLNSFFYVTKAVLKPMVLKKKGCIISISSLSGVKGWQGQTHYAASKAGLIGASKSLSKEVGAKNIRVNVITPGFVKTKMTSNLNEDLYKKSTALRRFGREEEIGDVVAYLVSDKSSYINGQVISVDGGEQIAIS